MITACGNRRISVNAKMSQKCDSLVDDIAQFILDKPDRIQNPGICLRKQVNSTI